MSQNVLRVVAHQLALYPPLPAPFLRAAATLVAEYESRTALLAARLDLPEDIRALVRADRRPEVRIAYCLRPDLETAELHELISTETRSAVLAGIAARTHDPIVEHLLWERLMAKPTRTLATALLTSLTAEKTRARRGQAPPPAAPTDVFATAMRAIGPGKLSNRDSYTLTEYRKHLAAGGNPATAEVVAALEDAPATVRVGAATSGHLTSRTRIVALQTLWANPLLEAVDRIKDSLHHGLDKPASWLPAYTDLATAMLTEVSDLDTDVLTYVTQTLDRFETAGLPAAWLSQWRDQLAAYAGTPCAEDCPACGARDEVAGRVWDPALDALPERDPNRKLHGPGIPQTTAAPDPVEEVEDETDVSVDPAVLDGQARLRAMNDYEIAETIRGGLSVQELTLAAQIGVERKSVVVVAAVLDRAEVGEDDAVALVAHDWFAPAREVVVRLVGARPGQPRFAAAAAGHAVDAVISAFGPAVFSPLGAPDPAAAGAAVFAQAVFDALAEQPQPGWEGWNSDRSVNVLKDLEALAVHPDVPDAALLMLPWKLIAAQVGGQESWGYSSWSGEAKQRANTAFVAAATAALGASVQAWETFARLGESFAGSVADLLAVAKSLV